GEVVGGKGGARARWWTRVSGIEQAPTRAALARGRGCVSITAHLGSWDLAGRALAALGPRVHVVMAPEADPAVETLLAPDGDGAIRVVRLRSPLAALELVCPLRRGELLPVPI